MNRIKETIEKVNNNGEKALSIFLTAGYPEKSKFVELALNTLNAGADMLEIGVPFSDPIADGPVIQSSSQKVLDSGYTLDDLFNDVKLVRNETDKPLILMGYSNSFISCGLDAFLKKAEESGIDGIIIPDIPLDEFDDFYSETDSKLNKVLLVTPTSTNDRIEQIDNRSEGFVYCVSVTGTTGTIDGFSEGTINNLEKIKSQITNNKMLIGFGISKPEDINTLYDKADGFIIGSAFIKKINNEGAEAAVSFIKEMKAACTKQKQTV